MNQEEALIICTMLEANYQPFKDLSVATGVWADAFKDVPFELVNAAVKSYMKRTTDDFRPNVGKITEEIDTILNGENLSEMEAWELIRKAVSGSTRSDSSAYLEWVKLPRDIQQVVSADQILRWQTMNTNEMDTVVQARFIKSYQKVKEREFKNRVLPEGMKTAFAYLQANNPDYRALPEATKPAEPAKSKTIAQILDEMDEDARKFREMHGMTANPDYEDRVTAFLQPVTEEDIKRVERVEKRKEEWSFK